MPGEVVRHLAAASRVADMNDILQVEMLGHRREIVGVVVHVVAVARLSGPAMAAAIMGDDAIAVARKNSICASQSSAESGQPWLNTMG